MRKSRRFVNSLTFQVGITARVLNNLVESIIKREMNNKLTLDEYVIIDTLVCYPHLDKNALSRVLVKEKSAIDKALSGLIKKKYIQEIKKHNEEIQVKYYEMTKEGRRLYSEYSSQNDIMITILIKFISETELTNFTKTLLKIRNILMSLSEVDYKISNTSF